MNINILDYREINAHGLSFELMVDGHLLGTLLGAGHTAIPYWLIENDLPSLPMYDEEYAPEIHITTVAACCGEYGCGHTHCRVIAEGSTVLWRDFYVWESAQGAKKVFRFTRANYDAVISAIAQRSKEYGSRTK